MSLDEQRFAVVVGTFDGVHLGHRRVIETALGTGLINACYGAPLSTVALQWYTNVKFASSKPIAYGIGALVVSKKAWDTMSPADQTAIRKHTKILGEKLLTTGNPEYSQDMALLEKAGIRPLEPDTSR